MEKTTQQKVKAIDDRIYRLTLDRTTLRKSANFNEEWQALAGECEKLEKERKILLENA